MMTEQREGWGKRVRQHRTVYRFGGAWAHALLSMVPWIDCVIILVLMVLVNRRTVISPGVVFDLPRATFREGMYVGLTALMITVARDTPGGEETLIFFDDDRYSTRDVEQMSVLTERVKSRVALGARSELLLLADKRVPHGDVVRFVNAVREAGVQRVNVAEKPE
ncbi:MAG: biopolymer transporter ExbD [bacterium]